MWITIANAIAVNMQSICTRLHSQSGVNKMPGAYLTHHHIVWWFWCNVYKRSDGWCTPSWVTELEVYLLCYFAKCLHNRFHVHEYTMYTFAHVHLERTTQRTGVGTVRVGLRKQVCQCRGNGLLQYHVYRNNYHVVCWKSICVMGYSCASLCRHLGGILLATGQPCSKLVARWAAECSGQAIH